MLTELAFLLSTILCSACVSCLYYIVTYGDIVQERMVGRYDLYRHCYVLEYKMAKRY